MEYQQDIRVLGQFAAERVMQLRRLGEPKVRPRRPLRRWLGERLVHLGVWVAAEPALRPVVAR